MSKRILTIALLYLKTTYSSRTTLIFSLAMPLLFTFVLGQALGNDGPGEGQIQITLGDAVDADGEQNGHQGLKEAGNAECDDAGAETPPVRDDIALQTEQGLQHARLCSLNGVA